VNDDGSRPVLEELKRHGVKYIALRCAGFNNVDLDAAKELGLKVVRVPAYSPEAVAEHAIGMMMSLNRRIHRAINVPVMPTSLWKDDRFHHVRQNRWRDWYR
jgi:D-lactate dehydrogenase